MTFMVKVIEDSISPQGKRLTTLHARYWRAIHSELMTHKMLSRNARSSRAVPVKVLLTEPIFIPQFGMNQPGMQSEILASPETQAQAAAIWRDMADYCRAGVTKLHELNIHKQHANRPLEWFGWIDVLITATEWNNFYALRISEYAQPEFDLLARMIQEAIFMSKPKKLKPGQWHLPFVGRDERQFQSLETCRMLSTARCARISYKPFANGDSSREAELARYESLVVSSPVHASPAEHQATPDRLLNMHAHEEGVSIDQVWASPKLHGNLVGWVQHRKLIPNEYVEG